MGLFDKLREAVNTVMDSAQSANDPLQDETIRKYYEILCGLRLSEACIFKEEVKNYIEFQLGTFCDDEKLQEALNLEALIRVEYPKTKKEQELKERLKRIKQTIAETNAYACTKVEAYNICCKELINEISSEYNMILEVIKDNVDCQHFGQGIDIRIYDKYEKQLGLSKVHDLICLVISNSFYEGNAITQKVILEYLLDNCKNRIRKGFENPIDVVAGIALKALHFEEYGENQTEYATITADDCRDFILTDKGYQDEIEKHPFEKEEYIERYIKNIRSASAFHPDNSSYQSNHLYWMFSCNDYFIDAACNHLWKEVAKEYIGRTNRKGEDVSQSKNASDVVNVLCDYFSN